MVARARGGLLKRLALFQKSLFCSIYAAALLASSCYSEATTVQTDLPKVVSTDLQEVDSFSYPRQAVNNQSGERLIVDALVFGRETPGSKIDDEPVMLTQSFTLGIPGALLDRRICVDISGRSETYRKMALLELVKPMTSVLAHIEEAKPDTSGQSGAVIVAFPAAGQSKEPLKACLQQNEWIYPARLPSSGKGNLVVQLRVNTGGSDASIVQVKDDASVSQPRSCERDETETGLYTRVCRIALETPSDGVAKVRLVVRQRNAIPVRKEFNVVVSESGH